MKHTLTLLAVLRLAPLAALTAAMTGRLPELSVKHLQELGKLLGIPPSRP